MKAPKLLLCDTGLAAHLAGVEDLEPSTDEPLRGALVESYVAQNIAGTLAAHRPRARVHHWRIAQRHEVDLVIEEGRDSMAIEVKAGARWSDPELAGLRAFLAATPRCAAAVLAHNGTEAAHLGPRLWALPIGLLLS